ncbi:hypothetical protein JOF36_004553 [Pseudonocardia parietis]|uniref:Uncharacterized protein n=1 Tax=Pseudonocardia parietis TaxID=570936 RepID=A0ABS4VY29_9PSEU|nr:hypothetical protein [Pseudonocardia parietis]
MIVVTGPRTGIRDDPHPVPGDPETGSGHVPPPFDSDP